MSDSTIRSSAPSSAKSRPPSLQWIGVVSGISSSGITSNSADKTEPNAKGYYYTVQGLFDAHLTTTLQSRDPLVQGSLVLCKSPVPAQNLNQQKAASGWPDPASQNPVPTSDFNVIAEANSADAQVLHLLKKFDLNPCFPLQCELEANALLETPGFDDPQLEDLTGLPFVTIDNPDSRDLDQAVFIELHADEQANSTPVNSNAAATSSSATVYYALADASWYVKPGTALHREALARGVTYYAPDRAVPMLPVTLSEGLVSLNPDVLRRALVFRIVVDSSGAVIKTHVSRALIRSRAKLSYLEVEEFLLDQQKSRPTHPMAEQSYADAMRALQVVGQWRINEAVNRDVIDYHRTEASVTTNEEGQFVIRRRQRLGSERFNEHISLLCNMEGARLLHQLKPDNPTLYAIFRIHAAPLPERLGRLRRNLHDLVEARNLDSQWVWPRDVSLPDYLESLPDTAAYLPVRLVIERMILLTNRASLFSDEPGNHHALGVELYARFSSPMREIVGIFLHKELLEALDLADTAVPNDDSDIQKQIVETANAARKLQKKLAQEARLLAIEKMLGADLTVALEQRPRHQGTIMGMRGGKIYVSIDGFGTDIKLYTDDLSAYFNQNLKVDGMTLRHAGEGAGRTFPGSEQSVPELKVADRLVLRTHRYNEDLRRYVLLPVEVNGDLIKQESNS